MTSVNTMGILECAISVFFEHASHARCVCNFGLSKLPCMSCSRKFQKPLKRKNIVQKTNKSQQDSCAELYIIKVCWQWEADKKQVFVATDIICSILHFSPEDLFVLDKQYAEGLANKVYKYILKHCIYITDSK